MSYEVIGWLIAIVVFIAAEAATVALVSVWFIGGAVCALIAAILGACADTGAVRVSGVLWTAKCATGERIEKGRHVTIERVEGAKLYVKPAEMPCEKA